MSSYNHPGCSYCGGSFNGGNCPSCSSVGSRNEFFYDPNPYSYNETPNFFNQPRYSPSQYETYSCEFCGNDAHYGYDCPPQVPFVYNQDPCFNQNFDNFLQTSPSFQQQYLCCENCGGPHETFQCQPLNQNFYEPNHGYNSNSFGFDQSQPPQFPVIHQPPQETSVEISQTRENLTGEKSNTTFKEHAFREKQHQPEDIQELLHKLLKDLQIIREELADYINTPNLNYPAFYDDDDEYTIQYREYLENSSNAITPDLSTEEPDNSLSMGDEHLSTILEKESNELINDDDSFENIDYVEASPPDSELVSLEEVKDDILHEKLLNIYLLIAKIESLNDNPTPDCVLKSPSTFPIPVEDSDSFFKKSDTSLSYLDNSLPEFETFSDHTEETSSGSTTTHSDNSLLEYESFLFEIEPDRGELTSVVMGDILGEHRVYMPNVLPTHPTLMLNSDFIPSDDSLRSDLEVSFPSGTRNKIFDPGIFFEVQSKRFLTRDRFLSHLSVILFVQIALDYEASRARGFVLRSLELKSLA
ncbi:hypothetical protein Tco_1152793 [Tanacetum coccineum]